jgi:PQQ-like domain
MINSGPQGGLRPDSRQPSRPSRLVRLLLFVAIVVVAQVALAGCGLVFAAQPGPSKGAPAGASSQTSSAATSRTPASWQLPQDAAFGPYALNSYLTGHQVIVVGGEAIASYDQRDGTLLWQVEPPSAPGYSGEGPAVFCGASSALAGTMLNVAYGPGGQCALVAAIDVSAGRVKWTAQLFPPDVAAGTTLDSVLAEAAGSAVVVGFNDQVGAFSAADGRFLGWHFTLTRRDPQYAEPDDCTVTDLLSAGDPLHVYFTDRCLLSGVQYGVIDAASATLRSGNVMPGSMAFKVDRAELVSVIPLVILLRADGLTRGEYLFFDSGTRLAAKLPSGQLSVSGALEIARVDPASGTILSSKVFSRAELTGNPNLALATQFHWGTAGYSGSAQRTTSSTGTSPGRPRSHSARDR